LNQNLLKKINQIIKDLNKKDQCKLKLYKTNLRYIIIKEKNNVKN